MITSEVVQDETDGEITDTYSPLTMIKARARNISGLRDKKIEESVLEEQENAELTSLTTEVILPKQNQNSKKVSKTRKKTKTKQSKV